MKSRLYRLRLRFTFPWVVALLRPSATDFGRAAQLAQARRAPVVTRSGGKVTETSVNQK